MKHESFFTVRPKLVTMLAEAGFECQRTPNIYDPECAAWLVPACAEVVEIFKDFYAEIDTPLPKSVLCWIEHNTTVDAESISPNGCCNRQS